MLKIVIFALILKLDTIVLARSVGISQKSVERLQNMYSAIEYTLMFREIDLDAKTFTCFQVINFTLTEDTNEFKFHAKNITISDAFLKYTGNPETNIRIINNPGTEFATYSQDNIIRKYRKVGITFKVHGVINDEPEGLYLKTYKEGDVTK